eukprot:8183767-Alexandrium_andersonii.AAC.1
MLSRQASELNKQAKRVRYVAGCVRVRGFGDLRDMPVSVANAWRSALKVDTTGTLAPIEAKVLAGASSHHVFVLLRNAAEALFRLAQAETTKSIRKKQARFKERLTSKGGL